ncbi:MAG TPA: DUF1343 domain-containing protein [Gemmatimonadaceae bacterium]|nr:DUF1343 domain-containing protein [Gemmatimonadaceae bacterium]
MRFVIGFLCTHALAAVAEGQVRSGLEVALTDSLHRLQGKRIGLITNHTGVDRIGRRNVDLLFRAPGVRLVALFGPEHGFAGSVRGGDRIGFATDTATGLPVYSLYGDTRVPTPAMLAGIDVLVYDVQDVGARVYTYVWTMALAAEAAARAGKEFMVFDRPNPIRADRVEGGVLAPEHRSFVGLHDVALRYGLTPGELLRYLIGTGRVKGTASVIPMQGYRREMWFSETGLPWLKPSPNIRDEEAALLYTGTVFFEATNLSEGRGTAAPLKQVGAPWMTDAATIATRLNAMRIRGIRFEATRQQIARGEKYGGRTIPMIRIHVVQRDSAEVVRAAAWLLRIIRQRHPRDFAWQRGSGIEQLTGTTEFRRVITRGGVGELLDRWSKESAAFERGSLPYLLY